MKKHADSDATLHTLARRTSSAPFRHKSLDEYLTFPRYEQFNESVYEDILYTKSQAPDSQGSHLMAIDLVSGKMKSQEHKHSIVLQGEYNGKPFNPIAYRERFSWEDTRSPIVKVPTSNSDNQMLTSNAQLSDHVDLIYSRTSGLWGDTQPFDVHDVGELGDDFTRLSLPSHRQQQRIIEGLVSNSHDTTQRLAGALNGSKEQKYVQSEALRRDWKGVGVTLEGITRPIDMPLVPHGTPPCPPPRTTSSAHSHSPSSRTPPHLRPSPNIHTNHDFESSFPAKELENELFHYVSPPVSPRILPAALQQHRTPPPSPPPLYYDPTRYQEPLSAVAHANAEPLRGVASDHGRGVRRKGTGTRVGADLSVGAGAGEDVISSDGSIFPIPELRRIWEISYFSGCDYNSEDPKDATPLSFPHASEHRTHRQDQYRAATPTKTKFGSVNRDREDRTGREDEELSLLLSSLCFDEDKYTTQRQQGRSLAQNRRCRPVPSVPSLGNSPSTVAVYDRRPHSCTCGAAAPATMTSANGNGCVDGSAGDSTSGGGTRVTTPSRRTTFQDSPRQSVSHAAIREEERWAAAREGGYGAGGAGVGGMTVQPTICICGNSASINSQAPPVNGGAKMSDERAQGRATNRPVGCLCECSDPTLCRCVPTGEDDFTQFQRESAEVMSKWEDVDPEEKQRRLALWLRQRERALICKRIASEINLIETMLRIAKRQEDAALSYNAWCSGADKKRSRRIREERLLRKQAEIEARVRRELAEQGRKGITFATWFAEKEEMLRYLRREHTRMTRERLLAKEAEEFRRRAGLAEAISKWQARERRKEQERRKAERETRKERENKEKERRERGEAAFSEWLYDYHEQLHRARQENTKKVTQEQKKLNAALQMRKQRNDEEYQQWLDRKRSEGINPVAASSRSQVIGADEEEKYHVTRAGPHTFGYGNRSDLRDVDPSVVATTSHAEQREGVYISHTPFYDLRREAVRSKGDYASSTISSVKKTRVRPNTPQTPQRGNKLPQRPDTSSDLLRSGVVDGVASARTTRANATSASTPIHTAAITGTASTRATTPHSAAAAALTSAGTGDTSADTGTSAPVSTSSARQRSGSALKRDGSTSARKNVSFASM